MPEKRTWDLEAGYIQRSEHALPRSGTKRPWHVRHNYVLDAIDHRFDDHVRVGRRQHLRHGGRGAAPPGEPLGGGRELGAQHRHRGYRLGCGTQRSRKITARWTMKLITVAVPWAITNATGTPQDLSSNCM